MAHGGKFRLDPSYGPPAPVPLNRLSGRLLLARLFEGKVSGPLPAFEFRISRIFAESTGGLSDMLGHDRVSGRHHQEAS
jgi:hypothetical protein